MILDVILYALSGVFFSLCAIRIFGDATPKPAILGLFFGFLLCRLLIKGHNGKALVKKLRGKK
jgi:hypothetical protein